MRTVLGMRVTFERAQSTESATLLVSPEWNGLRMKKTHDFSGNVSFLRVSLNFSILFFILLNGSFGLLSTLCHVKNQNCSEICDDKTLPARA